MGHNTWFVGGLMLGASLGGCGAPPLSDIASQGGSVPDPAGLIEGTVQYIGPRPLCEYRDGSPTRLRGVGAVLTLYGFDDLPPPNGPLPTSVLAIPMTEFFARLSDCMPENPTPADLHQTVTASAPYAWPRIPLGAGLHSRSYRIEAVFDRDGDYYPLLPLTHGVHTAGDAIGGATVGFGRDFHRIDFGGQCEVAIGRTGRTDGQVVKGVNVTIALPLWTERPMFEVKQNNRRKYLSSEQTIDLGEGEWGDALTPPAFVKGLAAQDGARKAAYLRLRQFAGLELSLISKQRADPRCVDPETPGADGTDKCVGPRLKALGLDYDLLDHRAYAWHLFPYDGNADGFADQHPLSFAFGPPPDPSAGNLLNGFRFSVATPWTFPQIFLARAKSEEEKLAGVPDAGLVGGVDRFAQDEASVYFPKLPVSVLPTVAISTAKLDRDHNGRNDCDVDVYPAGNYNVTYSAPGRYADCQELPVGDYNIVAITGVAGNVVYKKDRRSQTGWNLGLPDDDQNGKADPFSVAGVGQIWLHPNDLGDPSKVVSGFEDDPSQGTALEQAERFALPSQGAAAAFKIRDPNPRNEARPFIADELQQPKIGSDGTRAAIGDCDVAIVPGAEVTVADIAYSPIPPECCAPETVALCGIPRCAVERDGSLQPTRLKAWVADQRFGPAQVIAATDVMELEEQALTLDEAAGITEAGGTAIFVGRFVEVSDAEAADLVLPADAYDPARRQYITYAQYVAQDTTAPAASFPDCEAMRDGKDAAADRKMSTTVRLKAAQLEPACVPFLIPMGCCTD